MKLTKIISEIKQLHNNKHMKFKLFVIKENNERVEEYGVEEGSIFFGNNEEILNCDTIDEIIGKLNDVSGDDVEFLLNLLIDYLKYESGEE